MSRDLGFTHVEFLPIIEHPFDGSWGYQPTGMYRADQPVRFARRISPRWSMPSIAQASPCMLDWVPGHFPDDPHGLGNFDGTALYEHADPCRAAISTGTR